MKDKKWQLPRKLRLTPEKQAEADRVQKELASQLATPFGSMSPFEMERSRAAIKAEHLEEVLKMDLDGESRRVFKTRLAETYAILGRFDLSAELEENAEKRAEYVAILEAINRKDDQWCKCGSQTGEIQVSNTFVKRDIWSIKHNKVMPLLACRVCGTMNVAPLPKEQVQMRAARRRALELTRDLSIEEARKVLIANNHTTKQIVK